MGVRSWQLGGVYYSDLDEGRNRIEFGVNTAKAAERARFALGATDIPADAIFFDVAQLASVDDLPVLLEAQNGIKIHASPVD